MVVSAGLLAGLAWFMAVQRLDKADKWASVLGLFVGIVRLLLSVYNLAQTRRAALPVQAAPVKSTISGGKLRGPVLMGRDLRGVSLTGTPAPESPTDPTSSLQESAGVENWVENATMSGPLLMGRDMTGIVLPPFPDLARSTPARLSIEASMNEGSTQHSPSRRQGLPLSLLRRRPSAAHLHAFAEPAQSGATGLALGSVEKRSGRLLQQR